VVYKGRHLESGLQVAIKVMDLESAEDDIDDIQREITILKQLNSPYITKYYESFVEAAKLYLIMEFCQAGSLHDILKTKRPLDESYICILLRDILKALEYLHGEGKLHRDIKAANVLLNNDGTVRLCDFGVSGQLTSTLRKKDTFVGRYILSHIGIFRVSCTYCVWGKAQSGWLQR
jgi:serine/threonine-protein kinase 24/25/MST4